MQPSVTWPARNGVELKGTFKKGEKTYNWEDNEVCWDCVVDVI